MMTRYLLGREGGASRRRVGACNWARCGLSIRIPEPDRGGRDGERILRVRERLRVGDRRHLRAKELKDLRGVRRPERDLDREEELREERRRCLRGGG